jgi:hypothetical protein
MSPTGYKQGLDMTSNDIETADRLSRRRAGMLPMLAIIFLTQQAAFFSDSLPTGRPVDYVKFGAWLLLSAVLLAALATGGFWFKPKNVRALMEDDVTRANRAEAFRIGFLVTMIGGIFLYFVDQFSPMTAREAIHLLVTIGIATALIVFGALERRAHKDG